MFLVRICVQKSPQPIFSSAKGVIYAVPPCFHREKKIYIPMLINPLTEESGSALPMWIKKRLSEQIGYQDTILTKATFKTLRTRSCSLSNALWRSQDVSTLLLFAFILPATIRRHLITIYLIHNSYACQAAVKLQ